MTRAILTILGPFFHFPDGRCGAVFDCGLFGISDFVYA